MLSVTLDGQMIGRMFFVADVTIGGANIRVVIFCLIDTLLSRLAKLVKYKTRKHAREQAGVGKNRNPSAHPKNSKDMFVIK